jgi:hypothetical protein
MRVLRQCNLCKTRKCEEDIKENIARYKHKEGKGNRIITWTKQQIQWIPNWKLEAGGGGWIN